MSRYLIACAIAVLGCFGESLEAKVWGKVDLSPSYVHLDILEANRTVQKIDMAAIRVDGLVIFCDGWCVKPLFMYGKNNAELTTAGIGFGHCIPFWECYYFTPTVGVSYTNINTTFHLHHPLAGHLEFHERFRSLAPYVCFELSYSIRKNMRITGSFQWAWSRTHTKIKGLINVKSNSNGPNVGLQYEYDLNKCWSVNIGAAYNESMGETKDGIRAWGGKLGLARWF
jgi:hypothetical protein